MAKARLPLLLRFFSSLFLSLKDIHLDQNHDRTLLSDLDFCQRTLVLGGLETAAGQEDPCMLLHVRLQRSKWNQQEQPWSLRQEATLYAGASFDTFTEMCHEAYLSSQPMICDALYGSNATH